MDKHTASPHPQHLHLPDDAIFQRVKRNCRLPLEDRETDHSTVLMVAEGTIKASVQFSDGRCRTITLLRPGDFFGSPLSESFPAEEAVSVRYRAMTNSAFAVLDRVEFDRLLENPALGMRYFRQLTDWVSLRQQQVSDHCFGNAMGRMRTALASYVQGLAPAVKDGRVIINPSRKELSMMAGLSQAHAIRTIRRLADAGEIEMHGRFVICPAPEIRAS